MLRADGDERPANGPRIRGMKRGRAGPLLRLLLADPRRPDHRPRPQGRHRRARHLLPAARGVRGRARALARPLLGRRGAAKNANNLARIELTLANQPGALGLVCTLVGEQRANIDNLQITTRKPDFFQMSIDLEVRDTKHLGNILTALRAQIFVNQAIGRPAAPGAPTAGPTPDSRGCRSAHATALAH